MTRRSSQVGFPRIVCGQAAGSLVAAQCPSRVRKRTSRLLSSLLPEPRAQASKMGAMVGTGRDGRAGGTGTAVRPDRQA